MCARFLDIDDSIAYLSWVLTNNFDLEGNGLMLAELG